MRSPHRLAVFGCCLAAVLAFSPAVALGGGLQLADALRLALAQNPAIALQRGQLDIAGAQALQAGGPFDWVPSASVSRSKSVTPLTALERYQSGGLTEADAFNTQYQLGMNKLLRNGMNLGVTVSDSEPQTNTSSLLGVPDKLNRTIAFTLTAPLMKSAGKSAGAQEEAARVAVAATRQQLRQQISQVLLGTLQAYWGYVASDAVLKVAQDSEARAAKLLDDTERLIAADEQPRASADLLRATYADRTSSRISAEQSLIESRKTLGRLLGLDAAAIDALPSAADAFPVPERVVAGIAEHPDALAERALDLRPELRVLKARLEASRILIDDAQNNLKPQLDLQMGLSYNGVADRSIPNSPLSGSGWVQAGPSVFAGISYSFPVESSQARGLLLQRSAEADQLDVQLRDTTAGVLSGIRVAASALRRAAAQLEAANTSVGLFRRSVDNELTRQRLGQATLVDVISVEDRLNSARVNSIQAGLNYANALAQLRFETGTLLPPFADAETASFRFDVGELLGAGPLAEPGGAGRNDWGRAR